MLDAKLIRNNPDLVKQAMRNRNKNLDAEIDRFLEIDRERRTLIQKADELKNEQNKASKEIPLLKKQGADTSEIMARMKAISEQIKELDAKLSQLEEQQQTILYSIPNVPHETVPVGKDDSENVEIRRFGTPRNFEFTPLPHWEIGKTLNILDPETAAKVTGARFHFYRGLGARLERAIVNFFLDTHTSESGYVEVFPPFLANTASMRGTGQLPKFAEDMYHVEGTDFYLIPTAEVPVTNMYRDQILDGKDLPIKHCAYSACFRGEAGAAGRDTRGIIRQHQFNKVELVKFTKPEESYAELESLTRNAELVLQKLGLPYRVVRLCGGDLGFSSAMTYDIEVWMPSYGRYLEISSCSNFEDFQARRANIRFRRDKTAKPELVHTLNGSGVAVGRTVAAILENFQQSDGSILIPEVLWPYMGGVKVIK